MENIRYEVWLQNQDKFVTVTVYNCPNTEKYRVNKIHIGIRLARYEFYWPDIFPY